MPVKKLLKEVFNCWCIELLSNAGLWKVKPTSLVKLEIFIPPNAVNCAVLDCCTKPNTALPPKLWADTFWSEKNNTNAINQRMMQYTIIEV